MRIALGELRERDVLSDARTRDADRAVHSPRRFKRHPHFAIEALDPEVIVDVNQGAIAGVRGAVATIVGTRHVNARSMEGAQRRAAGPLLPVSIAPTDALTNRPAGAGEIEPAAAVGYREAMVAAFGI